LQVRTKICRPRGEPGKGPARSLRRVYGKRGSELRKKIRKKIKGSTRLRPDLADKSVGRLRKSTLNRKRFIMGAHFSAKVQHYQRKK